MRALRLVMEGWEAGCLFTQTWQTASTSLQSHRQELLFSFASQELRSFFPGAVDVTDCFVQRFGHGPKKVTSSQLPWGPLAGPQTYEMKGSISRGHT